MSTVEVNTGQVGQVVLQIVGVLGGLGQRLGTGEVGLRQPHLTSSRPWSVSVPPVGGAGQGGPNWSVTRARGQRGWRL